MTRESKTTDGRVGFDIAQPRGFKNLPHQSDAKNEICENPENLSIIVIFLKISTTRSCNIKICRILQKKIFIIEALEMTKKTMLSV